MYSQEDLNQILRDAKARHQGDARFSPPPASRRPVGYATVSPPPHDPDRAPEKVAVYVDG